MRAFIAAAVAALGLAGCAQFAAVQDQIFGATGVTPEQQTCVLTNYGILNDHTDFKALAIQDQAMTIAGMCSIDTGAIPLVIAIID